MFQCEEHVAFSAALPGVVSLCFRTSAALPNHLRVLAGAETAQTTRTRGTVSIYLTVIFCKRCLECFFKCNKLHNTNLFTENYYCSIKKLLTINILMTIKSTWKPYSSGFCGTRTVLDQGKIRDKPHSFSGTSKKNGLSTIMQHRITLL